MKLSSLISSGSAPSVLGAAICLLSLSGAQAALNIKVSEMIGFSTGNLGAVGTAEGWNGGSGNVTVTSGSGSLDGTTLGLLASQGDRAFVSGTDATNTYNLFADSGTFPTGTSNKVYYSFLYKFNNGTITNANTVQKIFQVNRQNAGTAFTLAGVARGNGSGQMQVGVVMTNGTVSWASDLINPGQVVFLVYRHQIIPPAGSADVCDLWVNPAPGSFGTNEANVPSPSASVTNGGEDGSNTGPGRFYVVSGASAEFDELRISTNWAEVTPPVNVCNSAGVSAITPAAATVTADIRASFSVLGSGTSPAYQWQLSTDGGSNFSNISGANGANYTTPPLATSDSGNKYRCVVHVVCNNSFATSSVATVTVNPAVPTPAGVLVDDVWADTNRRGLNGNNQVDSSNSVWFASSTITLDSSSGQLVATPASSNSVLWVGYFTPTNSPPVHLAVGSALKVTLPFVASNIPTNSGNSMRFGLFDYFDGGLRISGDTFGSGSTGNGIGVLGYMLTEDWGTNFAINSPMGLSARTTLSDTNLMGSSGDFTSIGSGPGSPLFLTNAPAFSSGTQYTLDFTVARPTANSTVVTTSITGAGTNYTTSVTDTNFYYHRFDSFAIRPATLETTADNFTFSRFLVRVINIPVPFSITSVTHPTADSAVIAWDSISGQNYQVQSRDSLITGNWVTNTMITATGASTSYTNSGISGINARFFRVVNTP